MVFPINIGFRHEKDIVKEEVSKVLEMVALPVLDSQVEILDGELVLCSSLCLVDFVSNAFGRIRPLL